jgi:hypothetical protein
LVEDIWGDDTVDIGMVEDVRERAIRLESHIL